MEYNFWEKVFLVIRENELDKKPISTLLGIIGLLYIILFEMSLSSELGWFFPLFIGVLIVVLSYVIIRINRIIDRYINKKKFDKKSASKPVIIAGIICIILGIVISYFSRAASFNNTVGVFSGFIGFLIFLYGVGLYPRST